MEDLNQMTGKLKDFWASRSSNQRIFLVVGAVATIALLGVFTNLMLTPDYKMLVTGLETADSQALTTELGAKKIPFQVSPDGKTISVPADQLDAARLDVAANDSTHSGRMGFEIFDKVSWGQTEFDEKVNYQRALEGELERTITTLGGVKSARVHLVMATESVFLDRERSAKASVTLKLGRNGLTHEETTSIQRLVAGAVDGLKPADVSIIDADSNQSLGSGGDMQGGEEGAERQLSQRLMATISPIVGAQHLRASVNVEYEQGTTEINQDKYDPAVSVPLTIQRSDEQTGSGAGVGGVPGTTSNVPQQRPNVPAPTGGDGNQSSKTESATYGVNKTTSHSIEPAGRIHRITAALVVDDVVRRTQDAKGKWSETRTKRSPQELKQIEVLAQNAIGLDTNRGDVISVENLAFDRPDEVDVPAMTVLDKARKGVSDFSTVLRSGMLLALFAMAYFLMLRPMQKRVLGATVDEPESVALQAGVTTLPLAAPTGEGVRALQMKEQVIEQVKSSPSSSARVVQAWLRGEVTE